MISIKLLLNMKIEDKNKQNIKTIEILINRFKYK